MLSNFKRVLIPPNVSKREVQSLDSSPSTIKLSKKKKK